MNFSCENETHVSPCDSDKSNLFFSVVMGLKRKKGATMLQKKPSLAKIAWKNAAIKVKKILSTETNKMRKLYILIPGAKHRRPVGEIPS